MGKVLRWDMITVGHLSRNLYWGEPGDTPRRSVLATSALVMTDKGNLLIDPSMKPEDYEKVLFENSGLTPKDIHVIFTTHFHPDHWLGAELFPDAEWYMSREDAEFLKGLEYPGINKKGVERIRPAGKTLMDDIFQVISLPGHTKGLCGLLFDGPEGRILASGDCVMTKEFFEHGKSFDFGDDIAQCEKSMRIAASLADVIIPGHGNYFLVKAHPLKEQS